MTQDLATQLANADIPQETGLDELTVLKQRADMIGVSYSNNIGLDTLKKRIEEHLSGTPEPAQEQPAINPLDLPVIQSSEIQKVDSHTEIPEKPKLTFRQQCILDAKKLIRVRIDCNNPTKRDLHGEILCVANSVIGEVKRYVPFGGPHMEDGWHVEQCLLDMLRERKYLSIRVVRIPGTKETEVRKEWVREFNIEILPPLTQEEIKELARRQEATGSIG